MVLPFQNLSPDPDNPYFADGIQEEILTRLAGISDLKVISRTSTQRYQSRPRNLSQIAKQLGVANILEGSVQKAGDQVRVKIVWGGIDGTNFLNTGGKILRRCTESDTNANTLCDSNHDSYTDGNCNTNGYIHGYSDLHAQADSHAKVCADSETSPDACAESVTLKLME